MKGNFKLDAANGPALGENLLTLSYSAADTPGATSPDGTLTTTHPTPDHTGDWIQTLTPEQADLHLDVHHK
jgi:hypothetical protein